MKNRITILLIFLGLFIFGIGKAKAIDNIGIYIDEYEHVIVFPYEKNFRTVAKIINHSDEVKTVKVTSEGEMPSGGDILIPTGEYNLEPGQEAHCIIVFEVALNSANESGISIPIRFSWEGGEEQYTFNIKSKVLPFKNKNDDLSQVEFEVYDKYSNDKIKDVNVTALLPSGVEQSTASNNDGKYILQLPAGNYLKKIKEDYKINLENTGYFLQVSRDGYKSYLTSNFLPKEGEDKRTLSLEPLKKVGNYELKSYIKTGYSIWWLKSSKDGVYIAASQGAQSQVGVEVPSYSKVLLMSEEGKKIWENETGGECWGLDISSDGKYVASGCNDGKIYLWDKSGVKQWEYANEEGIQVNFVKFSPNNKYLLAGPVNNNTAEAGIFNVQNGNLKWSYLIGDYLREGQFSQDGLITYLDSANGIINALSTETGYLKWSSNGDHSIPSIFDISENTKQIFTAGQGKAFTALELNTGKFRWQTLVDQTVTAGRVADDGSMIGVSEGGMLYKLNEIGEVNWARLYGGVGHNGAYYTKNGRFILLGGPNPTLFDSDGNVLWQEESNKDIEMTGPAEQWTGGANDVWMNEDASLLVIGQDDGEIRFYRGNVEDGENDFKQMIGPYAGKIKNDSMLNNEKNDNLNKGNEIKLPPTPLLLAFGFLLIIVTAFILVIIKIKKK